LFDLLEHSLPVDGKGSGRFPLAMDWCIARNLCANDPSYTRATLLKAASFVQVTVVLVSGAGYAQVEWSNDLANWKTLAAELLSIGNNKLATVSNVAAGYVRVGFLVDSGPLIVAKVDLQTLAVDEFGSPGSSGSAKPAPPV